MKTLFKATLIFFSFFTTATFAQENSINFIPNGSFVDVGDIDGNGTREIATVGKNQDTGDIVVSIKDSLTGNFIKYITFFDSSWVVRSFKKLSDLNGDGYSEIALKASNTISQEERLRIIDPMTGLVFSDISLASAGDVSVGNTTTQSVNSSSLVLDASSNQFLRVTNTSGSDYALEGTIEAWIKILSNNNTANIIFHDWDVNPYKNVMLLINSNGNLYGARGGSTMSVNAVGSTVIKSGSWYHVAMTWRDNDTVNLYINGSLEAVSSINSGVSNTGPSNGAYVGVSSYNTRKNNYSNMLIDDIRIWSKKRTEIEIFNNKNREVSNNEVDLLYYWKLNGDYQDYSGNGNDLIPVGNPVFSSDVPY